MAVIGYPNACPGDGRVCSWGTVIVLLPNFLRVHIPIISCFQSNVQPKYDHSQSNTAEKIHTTRLYQLVRNKKLFFHYPKNSKIPLHIARWTGSGTSVKYLSNIQIFPVQGCFIEPSRNWTNCLTVETVSMNWIHLGSSPNQGPAQK